MGAEETELLVIAKPSRNLGIPPSLFPLHHVPYINPYYLGTIINSYYLNITNYF